MQMSAESKNHHFSHNFFFNVDISLIIALICLTTCAYSLEGRVSQHFDIVLSFGFIVCRRWKLEKKIQKMAKVTLFCHKIKTKA